MNKITQAQIRAALELQARKSKPKSEAKSKGFMGVKARNKTWKYAKVREDRSIRFREAPITRCSKCGHYTMETNLRSSHGLFMQKMQGGR